MASTWLLPLLCFGFAAAAVLCAASPPRQLTTGNRISIIVASFVLLLNAARRYASRARLSTSPVFSLSTSAAI